MKVLLDTNVLIYSVKYKVDLQELLRNKLGLPELLVVSPVIDELKKMKLSHKSADRIAASVALEMIQNVRKFIEVKMPGYADDAMVNYAKLHQAIVVTNDLELRYRLKEAGLKVLCLRQKSQIAEW